jgi:hypothetical protein
MEDAINSRTSNVLKTSASRKGGGERTGTTREILTGTQGGSCHPSFEGIPFAFSTKSEQTTFAPSAANASEIALPNPDEEPVTIATFSFSLVPALPLALVPPRTRGLEIDLLILID